MNRRTARSDIGQLRTLSPSRADLSDGDDDPSSGGGLFEELSYVTCAGEDDDSVGSDVLAGLVRNDIVIFRV